MGESRALDQAIADRVMGWTWKKATRDGDQLYETANGQVRWLSTWRFSQELNASFAVVAHLRAQGWNLELIIEADGVNAHFYGQPGDPCFSDEDWDHCPVYPTVPEAICQAALVVTQEARDG